MLLAIEEAEMPEWTQEDLPGGRRATRRRRRRTLIEDGTSLNITGGSTVEENYLKIRRTDTKVNTLINFEMIPK